VKNELRKHVDKFEILGKVIDEKLSKSSTSPIPTPNQSSLPETDDVEHKMLKRTIESQKTSFLRNLNSMQKQVDQYKKQMDDMETYNSKLHSDFELLVDSYNKKIVELEKDIQNHYLEEYKKNIKEYKERSDLYELLKHKLEDMELEMKGVCEKERNASRLKEECLAKLNEMNKKTSDIVKERNELYQKCTAFEIRIRDLDSREQLLIASNNTIETLKKELENKQRTIDEYKNESKTKDSV
jgi:DNA repair exonuclease SbcCD ATPase subunit